MKQIYFCLIGSLVAFSQTGFAEPVGQNEEIARNYLKYDEEGEMYLDREDEYNLAEEIAADEGEDPFAFDFDLEGFEFDNGEITLEEPEVIMDEPLSVAETPAIAPVENVEEEPQLQANLEAEVEAPAEVAETPAPEMSSEENVAEENPHEYVEITTNTLPSPAAEETVATLIEEPKTNPVETAVKMFEEVPPASPIRSLQINMKEVFAASPIIYLLLLGMSICTLTIWFYSLISVRRSSMMPEALINKLREKIQDGRYDEALTLCQEKKTLFSKMIASGISAREHGLQPVIESMHSEGRRASVKHWQRLTLLNDIAIIAPMIGLMGTVLGMFYAFYDLNRSKESFKALFDGLGVSVGTTVAGLSVAILAMIASSTTKYRLVRLLASAEQEGQAIANIISEKH
jgi:biopolymer transport protein ExbB